jgi:hypothetical protein
MPQYRLYGLDELGRMIHVEEITAPSDGDAIDAAKAFKKPTNCELWSRAGLVATVPAAPEAPK